MKRAVKTVEEQRKDFFEREQKAYDERMKQANVESSDEEQPGQQTGKNKTEGNE